jgi:hypothetical protein
MRLATRKSPADVFLCADVPVKVDMPATGPTAMAVEGSVEVSLVFTGDRLLDTNNEGSAGQEER